MKYTIEFTEVIAYLSQDIEADSKDEAIEKAFKLMQDGEIVVVNSNMDYCISTEREEEPKLPDGLQKYIDGVGLNILYSNYHKSTNGIWSRAEVDDHWEKDGDTPEVWDVIIDYGCQDDTGGSSYSVTMYFFKKDGEWTCDDVSPIDADWLEDPADRDDRLYHEEQDHIAMEKAKVDQKVHNHPLGTGFAHKDKETK